jgi:hypothetical protein
MADAELEREWADLLDEIETGEPLTEEQKRRIAAVAAAQLARPRTPIDQALTEVAEAVVPPDRSLLSDLDFRVVNETIEILGGGEVIAAVSRSGFLERVARLAEEERRDAGPLHE